MVCIWLRCPSSSVHRRCYKTERRNATTPALKFNAKDLPACCMHNNALTGGKSRHSSHACYHVHSLDVTRREHRPFFEPMTGSLGTTPSIHHQLESTGHGISNSRSKPWTPQRQSARWSHRHCTDASQTFKNESHDSVRHSHTSPPHQVHQQSLMTLWHNTLCKVPRLIHMPHSQQPCAGMHPCDASSRPSDKPRCSSGSGSLHTPCWLLQLH
jgi:hypothetical protein